MVFMAAYEIPVSRHKTLCPDNPGIPTASNSRSGTNFQSLVLCPLDIQTHGLILRQFQLMVHVLMNHWNLSLLRMNCHAIVSLIGSSFTISRIKRQTFMPADSLPSISRSDWRYAHNLVSSSTFMWVNEGWTQDYAGMDDNRCTFIWMLRLSRSPCQFETQDIKTQPHFNHYLGHHNSGWVDIRDTIFCEPW